VIDLIDQKIEEWAKAVVGPIEVSFEPPGTESTGHKIGAYLFEMNRVDQRVGGRGNLPLKLDLRYLITSWSLKPKESHRALAMLLFNAYDSHGNPDLDEPNLARSLRDVDSSFDLDCEELSSSFWTAFKCSPRPCFVLRIAIFHEGPATITPTVQSPPSLQVTTPVALFGEVLGPNHIPIVGATLEIPGLGLTTTTNNRGAFRFEAVPSDPRPTEILVQAKGTLYRHLVEANFHFDLPLTIELPIG
jgi:hypothetical protein